VRFVWKKDCLRTLKELENRNWPADLSFSLLSRPMVSLRRCPCLVSVPSSLNPDSDNEGFFQRPQFQIYICNGNDFFFLVFLYISMIKIKNSGQLNSLL